MESLTIERLTDHPGAPTAPLYTIGSVAWATFFGSPLAGGIILAKNYRRLGHPAEARKAVLWSLVASIVIFSLVALIPNDTKIPNHVFTLPQIWVMHHLAQTLQGSAIRSHQEAGGTVHSRWRAIGIGALTGLAILAVIFTFSLLTLLRELDQGGN